MLNEDKEMKGDKMTERRMDLRGEWICDLREPEKVS